MSAIDTLSDTPATEWSFGGEMLKGCGHQGEVDVFSGKGKLSWKVEFAARWSALKVQLRSI